MRYDEDPEVRAMMQTRRDNLRLGLVALVIFAAIGFVALATATVFGTHSWI